MNRIQYFKMTVGGVAVLALVALSIGPGSARADNEDYDKWDTRIQRGFEVAPVRLSLAGNNRLLVGLGSYLVNAAGGCNDCHTNPPYAPGGNPFMGEPKLVNAAGYLAGGTPFIPAQGTTPAVVSRNLTPDKTGKPGGASFKEFLAVMRTGIDPHQAHPQFGPYLQVMPWPVYQDLTDLDLRAIYEYLSAIPCVEGDPGLPNPRPEGTRCK